MNDIKIRILKGFCLFILSFKMVIFFLGNIGGNLFCLNWWKYDNLDLKYYDFGYRCYN